MHNKYPMKQYIVYAHSFSLGQDEPTNARYTDEAEATRDAAHWAKSLRASKYLGATDWEAWVRIERESDQ